MKKALYYYFWISLSFIIAFMLTLIPIARDFHWLRPDFVTLVLIYWVAFLPMRVGVFSGFIVGILMDLLGGMLLGTFGLTLAFVAYLTNILKSRLHVFRYWQHLLIIFILVGFDQLIRLWIQLFIGHPPQSLLYWASIFVSALIWPILYISLQTYQRTLRIN